MVGYSLWTNWTTVYLVEAHRLTLVEAAWYAWIPPVFAAAGGFAGGWLSLRLIDRGMAALPARFRVCLAASVLSLATAAIPAAPSAAWACAGISLSIFAVSAFSVNMYTLPLDAFGGARAAFAVSILVASYGVAQFIVSPLFGRMIDRDGYAAVTALAAVTPLAACAVLVGHEGQPVKQRLKQWIFRLLGKDPEAVVVTFASGPPDLCRRMAEEVRALVPDRRHFRGHRGELAASCAAS